MKENKKFSDFKGSNVHELSNEAFIPVVTPDENFKINVTELSTEELHAGNNIEINNEHKIIATNTELTPGNEYISIENDIISYTGPKGTSRTITPAKYSVPGEELQNIEINDNKIDLVLTFGEEVNEEHRSNKIPSVASNSTGSYFKYKDGSLVLEPHFAGFNNRMLFFNKDLDTIPPMSIGTELFRLHIDIDDNKQDGIIYLDRGRAEEPIYYLNNNGEFVTDINDAINVLPYSQIIYDFKTVENQLYSINIHSNWLRRIAHKEITLIQLNKSTKNFLALNPAVINIVNDDPEPSHIANYYFYHNGKLYTKENVIGEQVFLIFGNVLAIDPEDTNVYTELRSNTGEINSYTGAIRSDMTSFPFASHIDPHQGPYNWIINTVNRFYCITEDIDENTTNFYIIESMY